MLSLTRLGAVCVASIFLFANSGDFARATKSMQPAPAQPAPVQPVPAQAGPAQAGPAQPAPAQSNPAAQPAPEQPAQNHAAPASWSGAVPDAGTCYPLMRLCFSNKIDTALIGTILLTWLTILYNSHREQKKRKQG